MSHKELKLSSSKGIFTSPQSIRLLDPGSLTINLSLGLLPVLSPVSVEKAPLFAITPSPLLTAAVINSSFVSS